MSNVKGQYLIMGVQQAYHDSKPAKILGRIYRDNARIQGPTGGTNL
jgi:hypothetical protein